MHQVDHATELYSRTINGEALSFEEVDAQTVHMPQHAISISVLLGVWLRAPSGAVDEIERSRSGRFGNVLEHQVSLCVVLSGWSSVVL